MWSPSKEGRVERSTYDEYRWAVACHIVLLLCAVCLTPLGWWTDPNNFRRLMRQLTVRAGVPQLTPKGLRHTAQLIGRFVVGDDKVMQERLGHSDVEITLGAYAHVVDEQLHRSGDLIDAVFLGQT